jgi:hypothetical protein
MTRGLLVALILITAGCSWKVTPDPLVKVRELAGTWEGRLALPAANARASLTIKEDGTYAGTMHLESGDRPFTGTMVESRDRVRYHGTHGDGTVVATPRTAPPALLQFVPDGGDGGGSFTRVE